MKKRMIAACVVGALIAGGACAEEAVGAVLPQSGTKEAIIEETGCLKAEAFSGILSTETVRGKKMNTMTLWLESDYVPAGSDRSLGEWKTCGGAVSETTADLDGDGTKEYVLLCAPEAANDSWTVGIYEPEGDAYTLSAMFNIEDPAWLSSDSEKHIWMIPDGKRTRIAVHTKYRMDGNCVSEEMKMYSYDGESTFIDAYFYASLGGDSCAFIGPMPVDEFEKCEKRYDLYDFFPENTTEYEGFSGYDLDQGTVTWAEFKNGVEQVSALAKPYGVTLSAKKVKGWEEYDTEVSVRGEQLYGITQVYRSEKDSEDWGICVTANLIDGTFTPCEEKVKTTGSVHLRVGPGLDHVTCAGIKAGKTLDYLGKTVTDERGVDWYYVRIDDRTGWVSSKYSEK